MPSVYSKNQQQEASLTADESSVLDEVKKLKADGFSSTFGSLCAFPENVTFESEHDDEQVLVIGRAHMVTNWSWVTLICFLIFIPVFWSSFPLISVLSDNLHFAMTVLWYLALSLYGLMKLLLWFYSVYIVTNERIIDVDFFGLLYKNINVTMIDKIEDVNYSQTGLLASIFNFGDLIVETASEQTSSDTANGERSAFTFENISNPDKVSRIITLLMEEEEKQNK